MPCIFEPNLYNIYVAAPQSAVFPGPPGQQAPDLHVTHCTWYGGDRPMLVPCFYSGRWSCESLALCLRGAFLSMRRRFLPHQTKSGPMNPPRDTTRPIPTYHSWSHNFPVGFGTFRKCEIWLSPIRYFEIHRRSAPEYSGPLKRGFATA